MPSILCPSYLTFPRPLKIALILSALAACAPQKLTSAPPVPRKSEPPSQITSSSVAVANTTPQNPSPLNFPTAPLIVSNPAGSLSTDTNKLAQASNAASNQAAANCAATNQETQNTANDQSVITNPAPNPAVTPAVTPAPNTTPTPDCAANQAATTDRTDQTTTSAAAP